MQKELGGELVKINVSHELKKVEKEVEEVMGLTEWKERYKKRKEEKAAFKPYEKMFSKIYDLTSEGKYKELREFVLHNVMQEEIPAEFKYTQLGILASNYERLGAYETSVELYDAMFVWFLKDGRTYDDGVEHVMEQILQFSRPDLLEKWLNHYGSEMTSEAKRKFTDSLV